MMEDNTLTILSNLAIFRGLTDDDLSGLVGFCKKEVVKKDDMIIREGQTGESLFIVIKGSFRAFLPDTGKEGNRFSSIILNAIRPGDCIGEYAFVDNNPASASVAATEDSVLFRIGRQDFESFAGTSDRVGKTIYRNLLFALVARLRSKDKELDFFDI